MYKENKKNRNLFHFSGLYTLFFDLFAMLGVLLFSRYTPIQTPLVYIPIYFILISPLLHSIVLGYSTSKLGEATGVSIFSNIISTVLYTLLILFFISYLSYNNITYFVWYIAIIFFVIFINSLYVAAYYVTWSNFSPSNDATEKFHSSIIKLTFIAYVFRVLYSFFVTFIAIASMFIGFSPV